MKSVLNGDKNATPCSIRDKGFLNDFSHHVSNSNFFLIVSRISSFQLRRLQILFSQSKIPTTKGIFIDFNKIVGPRMDGNRRVFKVY